MTPQYLGNKALLNKKLTAFFASRTVQTARVMDCFKWTTSLNFEIGKVLSKLYGFTEKGLGIKSIMTSNTVWMMS